jgi:hypothetical protein
MRNLISPHLMTLPAFSLHHKPKPRTHNSASFKLAVEDCLDASFRVFLEDLYSTLYASASLAPPMPIPTPAAAAHSGAPGGMSEKEVGVGEEQETGQDSRPEVRMQWESRVCDPLVDR